MPQITKIADVFDRLRDGDVIHLIEGRVKSTFRRHEGENDRGAYSFQSFVITDGKEEIKVTFKDRDYLDEKEWKGKTIVLEALDGDNGFTGVYAKDDEYQGKKSRIIWVTPTGQVTMEKGDDRRGASRGEERGASRSRGSSRDESPEEREERNGGQRESRGGDRRGADRGGEREPARQERREPAPTREEPRQRQEPARPTRPAEEHPWHRAMRILGQSVNAMNLCLTAAMKNRVEFEKAFPGEEMTPEQFQAITSTHYITMKDAEAGKGVGLIAQMPKAFTPAKRSEAERKDNPAPKPEDRPASTAGNDQPPVEDDDVPF